MKHDVTNQRRTFDAKSSLVVMPMNRERLRAVGRKSWLLM